MLGQLQYTCTCTCACACAFELYIHVHEHVCAAYSTSICPIDTFTTCIHCICYNMYMVYMVYTCSTWCIHCTCTCGSWTSQVQDPFKACSSAVFGITAIMYIHCHERMCSKFCRFLEELRARQKDTAIRGIADIVLEYVSTHTMFQQFHARKLLSTF